MPPPTFSLRLQRGITGGFAPPTPSAIHTATKSNTDSHILVVSSVRADGAPTLSHAVPKSVALSDTSSSEATLVDELHRILKVLPTESPPGSEDIYGLDTSIAWQSDDLTWMNGGPSGCVHGTSTVQPTTEDKTNFMRAVEIINDLIARAQ